MKQLAEPNYQKVIQVSNEIFYITIFRTLIISRVFGNAYLNSLLLSLLKEKQIILLDPKGKHVILNPSRRLGL